MTKFRFLGTPSIATVQIVVCHHPFWVPHLNFTWAAALCPSACRDAHSRWEVAQGACQGNLPAAAEILPACQRQNVTLFSRSCGCEKHKSQDFASAPAAACIAGICLVDSKQAWRKVCVLQHQKVSGNLVWALVDF